MIILKHPQELTLEESQAITNNAILHPSSEQIRGCLIVALYYIGEELVSFAAVKHPYEQWTDEISRLTGANIGQWEPEVGYMWTHPLYRRRGIMNKILQHILLVDENYFATVNAGNSQSVSVLQLMGFTTACKFTHDGNDLLLLRRQRIRY